MRSRRHPTRTPVIQSLYCLAVNPYCSVVARCKTPWIYALPISIWFPLNDPKGDGRISSPGSTGWGSFQVPMEKARSWRARRWASPLYERQHGQLTDSVSREIRQPLTSLVVQQPTSAVSAAFTDRMSRQGSNDAMACFSATSIALCRIHLVSTTGTQMVSGSLPCTHAVCTRLYITMEQGAYHAALL